MEDEATFICKMMPILQMVQDQVDKTLLTTPVQEALHSIYKQFQERKTTTPAPSREDDNDDVEERMTTINKRARDNGYEKNDYINAEKDDYFNSESEKRSHRDCT